MIIYSKSWNVVYTVAVSISIYFWPAIEHVLFFLNFAQHGQLRSVGVTNQQCFSKAVSIPLLTNSMFFLIGKLFKCGSKNIYVSTLYVNVNRIMIIFYPLKFFFGILIWRTKKKAFVVLYWWICMHVCVCEAGTREPWERHYFSGRT